MTPDQTRHEQVLMSLGVLSSQMNGIKEDIRDAEPRLREVEVAIAMLQSHPVEPRLREAEARISTLSAERKTGAGVWHTVFIGLNTLIVSATAILMLFHH